MKKVIITVLVFIGVINFTGCSNDAHFKDANEIIEIVSCSGITSAEYIPLMSGDVIVKDESPTTITTVHDANDNKSICVTSGKAHIVRN